MSSRNESVTRFPVTGQPVFRLGDLFLERTSYTRRWNLPFDMCSLCLEEDPSDPSWVELPETGEHHELAKDLISFTTCSTPMILHYAPHQQHFCIHFTYEILPGFDLFYGQHKRFMFRDPELKEEMKGIWTERDPLRRLARAEAVAMKLIVRFWPEKTPVDLRRITDFEPLLRFVRKNLARHPDIPEMAEVMGWSEAHFARTFRDVFHVTPKQYLRRELFSKALLLLNDPGKSVKEVSEELGFSTEFNFSRFIRQCAGVPPVELRKGNRNPLYIKK